MQPAPVTKYRPFPPVNLPNRQWPNRVPTAAPIWCSVDLRDGNQALAQPMSVEEKLEYFAMLVKIGFKEIEVGFPSASQIEYDFIRRLIDEDRIPADVTVPGLTDNLIGRRLAARVEIGRRKAIVLPRRYVVTRFGIDYVRLIRRDGSVADSPVQTAPGPTPAEIEILSGLAAGDAIALPEAARDSPSSAMTDSISLVPIDSHSRACGARLSVAARRTAFVISAAVTGSGAA